MRISLKLVLIEIVLSVALFLAVMFSISSFIKYLGVEDLKIKIASLQDTASRLRFSIVEMTTSVESSSYLVLEYGLIIAELSNDIGKIEQDRSFGKLPDETKDQMEEVRIQLQESREFITDREMIGFLDLRNESPLADPSSLSTLAIILRETSGADEEYIDELENAVYVFRQIDQKSQVFEILLDRVLFDMLDVVEDYRFLQLFLALAVPAFILIVSLIGVLLFGNVLSARLRKLDAALSEVAGGDFAIRVEMKSRDEFNSLATSINAFTRTLGAKLESFRLIMHDIGQTLGAGLDSTQVEETILRLTTQDSVADGAALYKVGGESGELILSMIHGRFRPPFAVSDVPDDPSEEDIEAILRSRIIQPGKTVLGESAVKGKSLLVRDVAAEDGLDWFRTEEDSLFLASVIVVPLQVGSTVSGVLAITSSRKGRLFSDLEFANMQSFAELAAITLDNIYKYTDLLEATQLNRELGIAEEIQQDLLPKRLPRIPGGDVAYLSRSIKGLNGDYFDVYPLGEGKTMVTICEVAGRGVPAGLVMVMIRTILRLVATSDKDAQTIMTLLNQDMTRRIAIENYASVGILVLDPEGLYSFSSAAHYPLQILRDSAKEYEAVQTEGIPVGIDRDAEYRQSTGKLEPNDLVLFHTDGIPESRNRDGRVFGVEGLLDIVSSHAGNEPERIIDTLRTELEFFERGTDQRDDQTVIILKYKGETAA